MNTTQSDKHALLYPLPVNSPICK